MKLFEIKSLQHLPWSDPDIGWWQDNKPIRLYHGTRVSLLSQITNEGGLKAGGAGESKDWVSLTLDPNTAYGYAGMSGAVKFSKAKNKKKIEVPREDRAILVIEISNYKRLEELKGEVSWECSPQLQELLKNKEKYEDAAKTKHDSEIYSMSEIRFPKEVPLSWIKGYMIK